MHLSLRYHSFFHIFQKIDRWDFDIFEFDRITDGNSLKYIFYELLRKYDLLRKFKVRFILAEDKLNVLLCLLLIRRICFFLRFYISISLVNSFFFTTRGVYLYEVFVISSHIWRHRYFDGWNGWRGRIYDEYWTITLWGHFNDLTL